MALLLITLIHIHCSSDCNEWAYHGPTKDSPVQDWVFQNHLSVKDPSWFYCEPKMPFGKLGSVLWGLDGLSSVKMPQCYKGNSVIHPPTRHTSRSHRELTDEGSQYCSLFHFNNGSSVTAELDSLQSESYRAGLAATTFSNTLEIMRLSLEIELFIGEHLLNPYL